MVLLVYGIHINDKQDNMLSTIINNEGTPKLNRDYGKSS